MSMGRAGPSRQAIEPTSGQSGTRSAGDGDVLDQVLDGRLAAGVPDHLEVGQRARGRVILAPLAAVETAVGEHRRLAAGIVEAAVAELAALKGLAVEGDGFVVVADAAGHLQPS